MKIKEFQALTLKDCLHQVREELGPEAVILETRKCRTGGVMGIGTKEAVRIIAATGIAVAEERSDSRPANRERAASSPLPERPPAVEPRPAMKPPAPLHPGGDFAALEKLARLEREVQELRQGVATVRQVVTPSMPAAPSAPPHAPEPPSRLFPDLLQRLREADLSEACAQELLEALPDLSAWGPQARGPLAESALRDVMARRIESAGPIQLSPGARKVVALIGPTGVGKTTTIAKLAAHYALVEKRRVALITVDTYRIAAVEQLRTYSQIIDIPVKVAYNQAELLPALNSYADYDLVLVDTAGRSQKNIMQVSELKTLVEATGCETHLVLAASTKGRDLNDQIERFSAVRVDRLLFTKLDETTTYGTIYEVAARRAIPVSYITTGQKVPEDIEPADGGKLAAFVLQSTLTR